MNVQEITVNTRRQFKEYEFDDVKMTAILDKGESAAQARQELLSLCLGESAHMFNQDLKLTYSNEVEGKTMAEELNIEEPAKEEKKPAKKAAAAKKPAKKKATKKAKKAVTYDRALDVHKKEMGKLLDSIEPTWRKKFLDLAKELSVEFNGKDFLDDKGNVLEEFRTELSTAFSSRI
jgi:hypothetical protein